MRVVLAEIAGIVSIYVVEEKVQGTLLNLWLEQLC